MSNINKGSAIFYTMAIVVLAASLLAIFFLGMFQYIDWDPALGGLLGILLVDLWYALRGS